MKKDWNGVWVANVTPMAGEGLDLPALRKLLSKLIGSGVNGLCPAGTTGEGVTLSDEEFSCVVTAALEETRGKLPVVPGTGSNDTKKSIERTRLAKSLGATAALVVTPYYVKPTHAGLIRHYSSISEKVDLPLMLYNVPGRTGVNMMPETVAEVVAKANVVAIKECAPLPQVAHLKRLVGERISIFSGEDSTFLPFLALGGDGVVSVAANLIPKEFVKIYADFRAGRLKEAQKAFVLFMPLIDGLFSESNPIPIKAALAMRGEIGPDIRSPLAPLSEKNRDTLNKLLKEYRLENA
ncbi:MAG: 4-hydroxy-tetrahydrodipicolinate synthase [Pseudomonadota bacterium]